MTSCPPGTTRRRISAWVSEASRYADGKVATTASQQSSGSGTARASPRSRRSNGSPALRRRLACASMVGERSIAIHRRSGDAPARASAAVPAPSSTMVPRSGSSLSARRCQRSHSPRKSHSVNRSYQRAPRPYNSSKMAPRMRAATLPSLGVAVRVHACLPRMGA